MIAGIYDLDSVIETGVERFAIRTDRETQGWVTHGNTSDLGIRTRTHDRNRPYPIRYVEGTAIGRDSKAVRKPTGFGGADDRVGGGANLRNGIVEVVSDIDIGVVGSNGDGAGAIPNGDVSNDGIFRLSVYRRTDDATE